MRLSYIGQGGRTGRQVGSAVSLNSAEVDVEEVEVAVTRIVISDTQ
jgi:hypothetical protein